MKRNSAPYGFRRVTATREEVAEYNRKHGRLAPGVYRLRCLDCGKRIWGSGLGIGSHRRACPGPAPASQELAERSGSVPTASSAEDLASAGRGSAEITPPERPAEPGGELGELVEDLLAFYDGDREAASAGLTALFPELGSGVQEV